MSEAFTLVTAVLSDLRDMVVVLSKSEFAVTIAVLLATIGVSYLILRFVQHIFFLLKMSTMLIVAVLSVGAGVSIWLRFSISMVPSVYTPPVPVDPMIAPPAVEIIPLLEGMPSSDRIASPPVSSAQGPFVKPKAGQKQVDPSTYKSNASTKPGRDKQSKPRKPSKPPGTPKLAHPSKKPGPASPSDSKPAPPIDPTPPTQSVLSMVAAGYREFHTVEHLLKPTFRFIKSIFVSSSDPDK